MSDVETNKHLCGNLMKMINIKYQVIQCQEFNDEGMLDRLGC